MQEADQQSVPDLLKDSSDPVTKYLELALKIYLRIKNTGQTIHRSEFDDKRDPLYDPPAARAMTQENQ